MDGCYNSDRDADGRVRRSFLTLQLYLNDLRAEDVLALPSSFQSSKHVEKCFDGKSTSSFLSGRKEPVIEFLPPPSSPEEEILRILGGAGRGSESSVLVPGGEDLGGAGRGAESSVVSSVVPGGEDLGGAGRGADESSVVPGGEDLGGAGRGSESSVVPGGEDLGGATAFALPHPTAPSLNSYDHSFRAVPTTGRALLFHHPMLHRGEELEQGLKYCIRTDVMYLREEEAEEAPADLFFDDSAEMQRRAEEQAQQHQQIRHTCYAKQYVPKKTKREILGYVVKSRYENPGGRR